MQDTSQGIEIALIRIKILYRVFLDWLIATSNIVTIIIGNLDLLNSRS